ncbi:uncharacterized protein LOC127138046 [Lathyrus oleraceus]|uniref:uncharacterized protein LOC127138046 n=1 Tax=Pisum sativum TaxID=3888 RepID=UPI0021D2AB9A|nr:uncharacterized protein LOC127138046 [Pisum sativum]
MVVHKEIVGKDDRAIADAFKVMAHVMAQANKVLRANHNCGAGEFRGLGKFKKNNLPTLKGRYNPEGVGATLQENEKIFRVITCTNAYKVQIDVLSHKEIELLERKHGNMIVDDYVAKFEEQSRFCPHYNIVEAEGSKCVMFESGLCPEIKQFIGYQEILRFSMLVNKCRIYDEDSKARYAHYKSVAGGSGTSGEGVSASMICFKCGELGHHATECKSIGLACFKRGKMGHLVDYKSAILTCFNRGEPGHISSQCQKPKKVPDVVQASGKVFSLSGMEVSRLDNLILGTCFINGVSLVDIIDTGVTHSIISPDCVVKLNLAVSLMKGIMVIDTPINGSVTTSLIFMNCP